MRAITLFFVAGVLEIGGGYLVWLWLREHRAAIVGMAGLVLLARFSVSMALCEVRVVANTSGARTSTPGWPRQLLADAAICWSVRT